ncbi:MAG: MetS family NSS transporter small subunit [Bacteroidota bacterium]
MTTSAIISMIAILALVIGGFGYFLSLAIKKEREK